MNSDNASSLLLVYTDYGDQLSEHDFHEWYDTEHVPQRVQFPGCHNASRYCAIDSKQPPWAALYHVSSPDIPESKEWLQLNEQASDNEKTILRTIPIVTRSIYILSSQRVRELSTYLPTSGNIATPAGKVICVVHLHVSGSSLDHSELEADLIDHLASDNLSRTPGWLRFRVYKRYSGSDMKTTPELKIAMDSSTLVIHEWDEDGDATEISKLEANVTAHVRIWEKEHDMNLKPEWAVADNELWERNGKETLPLQSRCRLQVEIQYPEPRIRGTAATSHSEN